jgi:hypothetical protein
LGVVTFLYINGIPETIYEKFYLWHDTTKQDLFKLKQLNNYVKQRTDLFSYSTINGRLTFTNGDVFVDFKKVPKSEFIKMYKY